MYRPECRPFGFERDRAVRADTFAGAASYALVIPVLVVFELKDRTKTLGDMPCVTIFRITFGNLRRDKFLAGNLHAFEKACNARA